MIGKGKGAGVPVHDMRAYGGLELHLNSFLSLALDGSDKLHAAAAAPLEKDIPGTHCIGGCL
jgi:hypothetical protein